MWFGYITVRLSTSKLVYSFTHLPIRWYAYVTGCRHESEINKQTSTLTTSINERLNRYAIYIYEQIVIGDCRYDDDWPGLRLSFFWVFMFLSRSFLCCIWCPLFLEVVSRWLWMQLPMSRYRAAIEWPISACSNRYRSSVRCLLSRTLTGKPVTVRMQWHVPATFWNVHARN